MKKIVSRVKQYKEIEKSLERKFENVSRNEVVLLDKDFDEGKLTAYGYNRLKNQCEYIPHKENIEIILPEKNTEQFKNTLEYMASMELSDIRKDKNDLRILAFFLLLGGIVCFLIGYLVDFITLARDIVTIASWVFVWAAVEKWFFDQRALQKRRYNLLHILTAKIMPRS